MILAVLVVNDAGQARLVRWYEPVQGDPTSLLRRVFLAVSRRGERLCNFLEAEPSMGWKKGTRLVYRHYATLYFIFVVEETESELGILDLIQVFVETLDRCFESVCELDLIFHSDRVHYVLDEVIQGGLVLETNMGLVLKGIDDMSRMERTTTLPASSAAPTIFFSSTRSHAPSSSYSSSGGGGMGNTVSPHQTNSAATMAEYSQTLINSTTNMMEMGQLAASTIAQRASAYFS